ncbi:hypothetical protein HNR23_002474 [Nocardiopsis mwathae]|uniref:Uncharacterized protein n=1 Tax=Nocardiopsis mwathae TaxID=1472723 RepID=A0A7X0D6S6_9ACTN|nr:hypothetical protein [Nocardiopsis mwathae]MBB6172414.1 hypothetical protein [Nocardiopsis mwathae]
MSTLKTWSVRDRRELEAWARYHGTAVTIAEESWDAVTYRAEAVCEDGTRYRCLYREEFPPPIALKRRANTYTVALFHRSAGMFCYHVREVTPRLSGSNLVDPARLAELVAAARVQRKRREVCGATVENLATYTVGRTYAAHRLSDWRT